MAKQTSIDDPSLPDLDLDLSGLFSDDEAEIEVQRTVTPRCTRREAKQKVVAMMKREHLRDVMPAPPERGFTYHLVSNGKFDFWTWVPVMVEWIGQADELYVSTWTLNRGNCVDLFALIDAGKIRDVGFLTGLYFKRRESSVYSILLTGLQRRGFRYAALTNHAKVVLLCNQDRGDYIAIEGSANLTANPRIEQYTLCNDEEVYRFHRGWIEECLDVREEANEG